jgi:hypothetical protein
VVETVNQSKDRSAEEYDNFGKTGANNQNVAGEETAYQVGGGFRGGKRGGRFHSRGRPAQQQY